MPSPSRPLPPPPVAMSDSEPRPNWCLMRAARAHLLTAATLGLSAPPTIRKVETVGFAVAQAALSRVGSRVVCKHARTHARTRTHTRTHARARAHTHASTRAPSVPLPNQAAEGTRAGRTAALGFDPRAAHICARTGLTPTHICTRSQRCHYCASAPGQPLPTSAPGLRSATAHIFAGTGLTHCPHLRRDLAQPLPTSAPGLGSATAHICAATALSHCPHLRRDCARPLPTSSPGSQSAHISATAQSQVRASNGACGAGLSMRSECGVHMFLLCGFTMLQCRMIL